MESSARHSVCTLVETMVTSGEDQPNTVQLQELKRLCKRSVSKSVKVETHITAQHLEAGSFDLADNVLSLDHDGTL